MRSILKSLLTAFFLITLPSSVLGEDYSNYFPAPLTNEQQALINDIDYFASIAPGNTVFEFCPLCSEEKMRDKALELAKLHQEMSIIQASIINVPDDKLITFEVIDGRETYEILCSEFARIFLKIQVDLREAMTDALAQFKAKTDEESQENRSETP